MEFLPQFHARTELRYTATLIVGRYADWLNLHPQYIAQLLAFVCTGLPDTEIVAASALAFKHVCDGCRTHLAMMYLKECFQVKRWGADAAMTHVATSESMCSVHACAHPYCVP